MNDSAHPTADDIDSSTSFPIACGRMSLCVPRLTLRLRSLGICYVRMEYQGANGRGEFVHIEIRRSDGSHVEPVDPTVHSTVLQAVFRSLLSFRHSKWTEGNGSTGDFRWDLSADSLIHTHYTRGENGNERVTHHNL